MKVSDYDKYMVGLEQLAFTQYGHSQSEKKREVRDKYNRSIKVHT